MLKIIDDRMEAHGQDYLVFKVYRHPEEKTVFGYLICRSDYDENGTLNFVKTDYDQPVKEAFLEAVKVGSEFGKDFKIDYMWVQDLDNLFPPHMRPEIMPFTPDHIKEAS